MKILAIDTSTMMGSTALVDSSRVVGEQFLNISVTHSERLMPSIDTLLQSSSLSIQDIEAFAVAIGPGSFTGLRIGLAAVKGFVAVNEKPVLGISTLKATALNCYASSKPIIAVVDARRGEYYYAVYKSKEDSLTEITTEKVAPPDLLVNEIKDMNQEVIFVGEGVKSIKQDIRSVIGDKACIAPFSLSYPRASNIAYLALKRIKNGDIDNAEKLVPNYIRKSDAEK